MHPVGVGPAPTGAPSAMTWPILRQPRRPVVPQPGSVHLGGSSARPRTLLDILATTAAAHQDRPAIDDGRRCLDATLRGEANRVGALLAAHGVGRGHRVGIHTAPGCPLPSDDAWIIFTSGVDERGHAPMRDRDTFRGGWLGNPAEEVSGAWLLATPGR